MQRRQQKRDEENGMLLENCQHRTYHSLGNDRSYIDLLSKKNVTPVALVIVPIQILFTIVFDRSNDGK